MIAIMSMFIEGVVGVAHFDIASLLTRAQRTAARDHAEYDALRTHDAVLEDREYAMMDGYPVSMVDCYLDRRHARDTTGVLPWNLIAIEAVNFFDAPDSTGCIGTVELTYSREGWRALYGFTGAGDLRLWAN